jgi:hypothetical protein
LVKIKKTNMLLLKRSAFIMALSLVLFSCKKPVDDTPPGSTGTVTATCFIKGIKHTGSTASDSVGMTRDANNYVTAITHFDEGTGAQMNIDKITYTGAKTGKVSKWETYDNLGNLLAYSTYDQTSITKVIKKDYEVQMGNPVWVYETDYTLGSSRRPTTALYNRVESGTILVLDNRYDYFYDSKGNATRVDIYDSSNTKSGSKAIEYDAKTNPLNNVNNFPELTFDEQTKSKGNITKVVYTPVSGTGGSTVSYDYTYTDKGYPMTVHVSPSNSGVFYSYDCH